MYHIRYVILIPKEHPVFSSVLFLGKYAGIDQTDTFHLALYSNFHDIVANIFFHISHIALVFAPSLFIMIL